MKPESYKEVIKICPNCVHCFSKSEYDCGLEYYCTLDMSVRPPCDSVLMGESTITTKEYNDYIDELSKIVDKEERQKFYDEKILGLTEKYYTMWENWADQHAVNFNGTCDYFKKRRKL